jgi:hypothetical protein
VNLRTPPGPLLVAHDYMQLMFKLHVPVKPGTVVLLIECTRCGGNHPLSQCRWPLINK